MEYGADEGCLQLTLHFLITHLLQSQAGQTHVSAFVVQYFDSRPISLMEDIFPSLQEHWPHTAPSHIEKVLSRVQTYRALDYNGMSEAVGQISTILDQTHPPPAAGVQSEQQQQRQHHRTLLIIDGLDHSLSDLSRSSGSVLIAQAHAARLSRILSSLSRKHPHSLAILALNSTALPQVTSPVDNGSFVNPFPPVTSVFPCASPQVQVQVAQGQGQGIAAKKKTSPYVSPLARTFDQVLFDTHLLVSKVGDGIVVEVVKDRLGDGKGRWCGL